MKKGDLTTKAIGLAIAGVLAGSGLASATATSPTSGSAKTTAGDQKAKDTKAASDKHVCKGKNSCKGKGGCKTGDAGCAGKNSCKGKGGCASADRSTTARARTPARARAAARPATPAAPARTPARARAAARFPSRRRPNSDSDVLGGRGSPRPPSFSRHAGGQEPTPEIRHPRREPLGLARPRHRHRPADGPLRAHPRDAARRSTGSRSCPRTSWTRAAGRSTSSTRSPSATRSSLHGVSLSIGSTDPLDRELPREAEGPRRPHARPLGLRPPLLDRASPGATRTTCCRCPTPRRRCATSSRASEAGPDVLERPLVLENPSTYVEFARSPMPEWEFLGRLAEDADCGLLLDVNNVYVSSFNHGFDPRRTSTRSIPARVVQYHLAGHTNKGTHILDTHNDHVIDPVWELYRRSVARTGAVSTLLEWDEDIPAVRGRARRSRSRPRAYRRPRRIAAREAALRDRLSDLGLPRVQRWMQAVIVQPGHRRRGGRSPTAARAELDPADDRPRDPALEDAHARRARRASTTACTCSG